jgi:predicted ATPase/class 3 adenylate cyclase
VASPPTGTVTFLFTDIEGSTKMWEKSPHAMQRALSRHDDILRDAIEERGGYVFKTVGDAFCCAFPTAPDALEAALETQRSLLSSEWEQTGPFKVRMALHTGAAEERDGDYFGPPVNRVARLLSAAHGGQVLLSLPTHEMVRDQLPAGVNLAELGEYRLKDLFRPERIFQLSAPGIPSEFPPLRTLEARPNNLPMQPTPLVGREREAGEVAERLRSEEVRLLTLTGPGGTGKTRLALQAAADLLEEFEDGVFFVALAAITDPELVPSTIAEPLGVMESAGQSLMESLKSYLRQKHLLLVLDNFEQVLEGASVVGELVAACPGLKVLATSRIPLRLYGEQEYAVLPLALPDPRVLPPVRVLTQYEAVRLFVERARAIKADFEVNNQNAPAVAEICARLDGLPLAIELAAARVRLLSPHDMLTRLNNRLKLLKGGPRDLPTRQQTLRGTIDWSYELLTEEEKTLFGRLSVFSGGRTLEAIEEICDPGGDIDALEGIESLLEKNLLRREEVVGGESRFVMLETVHEYAREKLQESGETDAIQRRHAEFFLEVAEEAEPKLRGPEQGEWLERLETDHDNLRVALRWLLEHERPEMVLRLAGALWRFWYARGYLGEGRRWLEEALALSGEATALRVRVLNGAGHLAWTQGDLKQAATLREEGLKLSRQMGDKAGVAASLNGLSFVARMRGEYLAARSLAQQALAIHRELSDRWGIGLSLFLSGAAATFQGDYAAARPLLEEALAVCREVGDLEYISDSLGVLGIMYVNQEDYAAARPVLEEALRIMRTLEDRRGIAKCLSVLGDIALEQREHRAARSRCEEALMMFRDLGDKWWIAWSLEGLAKVAAAQKQHTRAVRLFGSAKALRDSAGVSGPAHQRALCERYLAAARDQLDEAAFAAAWDEGRAMILDEAISYALEGEEEATG